MLRSECRSIIDAAMRKSAEIVWIINQSAGELSVAAEQIQQGKAEVILEIGVQHGGWMYAMRPFCSPKAMYIAVDIGFSPGFSVYSQMLRDSIVDVRKVQSPSWAALPAVQTALGGFEVDVLHIDGSHKTEDALKDFDTFSPLVRAGGLVLMHDVCGSQGPGATLDTILHSSRASRIQESLVVCDTWAQPEPLRMGIAILRMRS